MDFLPVTHRKTQLYVNSYHHQTAEEHDGLEMAEHPHLADQRVHQVEVALEPDDRKEGSMRDVLEKVDVVHPVDQDVDLEAGIHSDRDSGLRLDDEDSLVLRRVRFHSSGLDLTTKRWVMSFCSNSLSGLCYKRITITNAGNTKGGSIPVLLTSCSTGLESAV